jgi:hypothetical protein
VKTSSRVQKAAARTGAIYGSSVPAMPAIAYRRTSPGKGGGGGNHRRNKSLSPNKRTTHNLPPINV